MSSRDQIIQAVQQAQPQLLSLPSLSKPMASDDLVGTFKAVLQKIGGAIVELSSPSELKAALEQKSSGYKRVISNLSAFSQVENFSFAEGHSFENTDLLVLQSPLAVAENGAIWVDDQLMPQRVLPFITQHLAVVIHAAEIVPTMHEAYEFVGNRNYGFGVFIAGPSKTADIEQSLVLGAHGPKTMTVFLVH